MYPRIPWELNADALISAKQTWEPMDCTMELITFHGTGPTPLIAGWFAGRTWKNNSKLHTKPRELLCNFYSMHIIYKCGRGPHNITWRVAGWILTA
jgi:hypothetical protein